MVDRPPYADMLIPHARHHLTVLLPALQANSSAKPCGSRRRQALPVIQPAAERISAGILNPL